MTPKRFKTKKGLWVFASVPAFLVCWLYPMHFGKGGSYPLGRLWFDFGQGDYGAWLLLAILSTIFGAFAALVGFAVQAIVVLVHSRSAQPQGGPEGSQSFRSVSIPPSSAAGSKRSP